MSDEITWQVFDEAYLLARVGNVDVEQLLDPVADVGHGLVGEYKVAYEQRVALLPLQGDVNAIGRLIGLLDGRYVVGYSLSSMTFIDICNF